jgi:hypothetical protein
MGALAKERPCEDTTRRWPFASQKALTKNLITTHLDLSVSRTVRT